MRRVRRRPSTEGTPDIAILARALPDLWPTGRPDLRRRVVAALSLLILAKGATLLMPFAYRGAVDGLTGAQAVAAPILLVVAYGVVRLMGTVLQQLRDFVFAPVSQHALRLLALRTFRHVHDLSLAYHIGRKTGALSRIIDRGVKAIDFLLRFLVFNIIPLIVELVLVAVIFWVEFGWPYFAVLLVTITIYVAYTFRVTEWRVKIRIEMNREDQDAHQKAVDSLLNYETVKYFDAERHEAARYDRAMEAYQSAAVRTQTSLAILNSGQAAIIALSMISVMAMAAWEVIEGRLTVGSFVMVNAFMIQITVPLNFLGTVYREIRQSLVDMREMYELTDQVPDVTDRPDAVDLQVSDGRIRFRDVSFGYEGARQILEDVDIDLPGGATLAVVGPTGAGKSTVARLLFRFYDASQGRIEIDGQDIGAVTQGSLRRHIGVVPQDTVLFNDSIGYNIGYGRDGATPEQIEAAARAARIHDFIISLPDGYATLVGERGLKLSGGEKQRVAIARTVLKDPEILILDEATSALDTGTERAIQAELQRLGRGRTVIMIAHRLSTVVDADQIIVLEAGRVVEQGTHLHLMALRGRYAAMWARQEAGEEGAA
ncbi:MAG: ABC transporter ATP-binding protein/permease [Pseudomonadota bacterium]